MHPHHNQIPATPSLVLAIQPVLGSGPPLLNLKLPPMILQFRMY